VRRLPIVANSVSSLGAALAPAPSAEPGEPLDVRAPFVTLVALESDPNGRETLAFAQQVRSALIGLGASPVVLVQGGAANPVGPGLAAWLATFPPRDGGRTPWLSLPTSGVEARTAWAEALEEPGPHLAIGDEVPWLVRASLVVGVGGATKPTISQRSMRVRPHLDAVIAEARPGFAEWLAGRMYVRNGPIVT
jgi:hypothetical protein